MPAQREWRDDLVHYLVTAGTVGRKKSEILSHFKNRVKAVQVNAELEALHVEDKVQKFTIPGGGRGLTIWRATTKMLEVK